MTNEEMSGLMDTVHEKADHWTEQAETRFEQVADAVGSRLKDTAKAVRPEGNATGMLSTASTTLADGLQRAAEYLDGKQGKDMAADIEGLIRRRPIQASLVGLVAAFFVGRRIARRAAAR